MWTSCWIIPCYLGGEFLMELTVSEGNILTSCRIFLSYLGGGFLMEFTLLKAGY